MKRKATVYYTHKTDTSLRFTMILLVTMGIGAVVCGLMLNNAGVL